MTHSQYPSFFLLVLIDSLVTIIVSSLTSNETGCALSIHSPRIAHPTFDRFPIVEIRRLVLSLSHLNPVESPIINRARQDLASQFPEAALVRSVRSGVAAKAVKLLFKELVHELVYSKIPLE